MRTRHFLATLTLACAAALPMAAQAQQQPGAVVSGEVLEVLNVPSYTYLRLKTAGGETWAAVTTAKVEKGAKVNIGNASTMVNFESKTLNRKFDKILFGSLVPTGGAAGATAPTMGNATPAMGSAMPGMGSGMPGGMGSSAGKPAAPLPTTPVAKAEGADGKTVAEVYLGRTKLKDKAVVVHARVVKFNAGIMGKNWLHLQDGSGSAQEHSNDVLATTKDTVAVGDVVTVRGTVRVDVNLGSGYSYDVLIEDAAVRK